VPKALGDFLVLDAVRATGGTAVAVSDADLLAEQRRLAAHEGTFIRPEGAACMTAAAQLRESGFISVDDTVVVLNTGTGLGYPETIGVDVPVLPVDGVIPTSPTQ
jgi:threonine synthase